MAIAHSPGASARVTDSLATVLVAVGVVLLALLTLYLVGFDQGAISRSGMYMHELMHDGRHLLGLPCH
ncbi:CbtB domain-containing protein [Nocardia cyriacigeorgica]|uniref:CbtB domain-containing protein n=1 Tax=Nocardia cyriacigeorgica TaxID=135487 RepID=UPI00245621EF|nr:CbtB-domain containing protein [Nocardia cyriacigeorgica]